MPIKIIPVMPKGINWTGSAGADTKTGTSEKDTLRGAAGADILEGGGDHDIFVFETSQANNGTDTILDFTPRKSPTRKVNSKEDILDFTLAFQGLPKIRKKDIDKYIWVEGGKVYVDITGNRTSGTAWAILNNIAAGDEIRVRIDKKYYNLTAEVQQSIGDTTAPTFDPSGNYSFSYEENKVTGALVATVSGASDNVGVTQYRFTKKDGTVIGSTTADGLFSIDGSGQIKMSAAGVASSANNYEYGDNSHYYYVQAGDAAGNWSTAQQIILQETNDPTDPNQPMISIGRQGAWFDANRNSLLDGAESLINTTNSASNPGYKDLGVDFSTDQYVVRFVDVLLGSAYGNTSKFDLTGFDSNDKLEVDFKTNISNWHNLSAWFASAPQAKTIPAPAPTLFSSGTRSGTMAASLYKAITNLPHTNPAFATNDYHASVYQLTSLIGAKFTKVVPRIVQDGNPWSQQISFTIIAKINPSTPNFEVIKPPALM